MISTKLGTSSSARMAAGDQGQVTGRKSLIMMEIFVPRLTHATPSTSTTDLSWRVVTNIYNTVQTWSLLLLCA